MKESLKACALLIAAVTLFFNTGCVQTFRPIAGIMQPGADRAVLIKASSWYPIMLVRVEEQSKTLWCMSKDDVKDCYFISAYDFQGHLVNRVPFPKFSDSCWHDFGYPAGFSGAVSPEFTSVAYLDSQNHSDRSAKDLCLFDARTRGRKVLMKGVVKESNYLVSLYWISQKELLAAVDDLGRNNARLLLIDTEALRIKLELAHGGVRPGQFALSHSKRYLAYWAAVGRHASRGSFRIFDLHEQKEVVATPPGELEVLGRPKWSPGDDALVYVMDDKLVKFSISSKRADVLKSLEPHSRLVLQDYKGQRLYYTVWPRNTLNPVIRPQYFDLAAGEERLLGNHPQGPFHLYVCTDGTVVYYKLGQEWL